MSRLKRWAPPADATPGFAIKLTDDTRLDCAMLICEDEDGKYKPVGVASTIGEAKEMAECHFRSMCSDPANAPICPYHYKLWAAGIDGDLNIAATITPLEDF